MEKTYEYGGKHFVPHSKLEEGMEISDLILESETNFPVFDDNNNKKYGLFNYSHESFYKAMEDSKMDIFKCVENGKLYIPCDRELYVYKGNRTTNDLAKEQI